MRLTIEHTKFIRNLILISVISLTGCAEKQVKPIIFCPEYPYPNKEEIDDMEKIPGENNFWNYHARLVKLAQVLETCKSEGFEE